MVDESGHDYGDCLYEEEKPTDAVDLDDGDNELEHIMRETNVKPLSLDTVWTSRMICMGC